MRPAIHFPGIIEDEDTIDEELEEELEEELLELELTELDAPPFPELLEPLPDVPDELSSSGSTSASLIQEPWLQT